VVRIDGDDISRLDFPTIVLLDKRFIFEVTNYLDEADSKINIILKLIDCTIGSQRNVLKKDIKIKTKQI
jgi:hypothetical protein